MRNLRMSVAVHEVLSRALLSIAALASAPALGQVSAYVSAKSSMAVIDTATNTLTGSIGSLNAQGTWPAAISSDGTRAYVPSDSVPGFVSVVNTASYVVEAMVEVDAKPVAVALTPNDAFAYVVNQGANTVSVVNTATNTIDAIVSVGNSPSAVVISPDGASAYVANRIGATISVIDTTTKVVDTIDVGVAPFDLAITVDGAFLYVTSLSQHSVSVIRTATRMMERAIPIGDRQRSIAMSPNGAMAYVAAGFDRIYALDTAAYSLVGMGVSTNFIGACDLGVTPDGRFLYATGGSGGAVDVYDANTLVLTSSIAGVGGCGLAITQIKNASSTEVVIDVKPGIDGSNTVNPTSNQNIPVAILTTDTFDALRVDPQTVAFGPLGAPESHGRVHIEDVDGDGNADLLFHFDVRQAGIECGDASATLVGETFAGEPVSGSDSLRTVGCR